MMRRAALACMAVSAIASAGCSPSPPAVTPDAAPPVAEATQPSSSATGEAAMYKPAPAGEISVATPLAGARIESPLVAEGSTINTWFFEGQFVAELVVDGEIVASAPAMQAGDTNWTDPGLVQFRAEIPFAVTQDTPAELILSEDMPPYIDEANDIRGPARSMRVPVVLTPAP